MSERTDRHLSRIWEPETETLPRQPLEALQLERLRALLDRLARVPFYREHLAARSVGAQSIRTLADIQRLPITTKDDLRLHHPLGFLAVPRHALARIHGSTGTTGRPTFVAYTARDLDIWSNLCARFLVAGGLRPEHTAQIAFGYGLFTGGFGLHYGIERVGAAIIPAAAGNTRRQIEIMRDLDPEVLICTPSYALTIADGAREIGIDPRALPIRYGHFGGEPGPRTCAARSRTSSTSRPSTTTVCPRSSAPASAANARSAPACTSRKTISWSNVSTPRH